MKVVVNEDVLPEELFNVVQFFDDESSEYVRRGVPIENAMDAAKHYTSSVATRMGWVVRVIITDMLDRTCFEWINGKGVTFPQLTPLRDG